MPDTLSDPFEALRGLEIDLVRVPGGHLVIRQGEEIENPLKRLDFYIQFLEYMQSRRDDMARYREPPVDATTFLDDPYFLGNTARPWPGVREAVIEACSGKYVECVFTGSIGTGKTTAALLVIAYHLYQLLLLRDPHREFEMDPSSEISFIMQSITGGTAFTVDYTRFRRMLEHCPWFRDNAPHDQERKSSIRFLKTAIMVEPLPGSETAAIGENVMGGLMDEVNHLKVIQNSSKSQSGGTWDQMLENYRSIARRRESRFLRHGRIMGMLCLVGSANYAGQFTDRKKEERDRQLERDGTTNIFIYDKRPWEVQPAGRFSEKRFRVFVGDGTARPRVLRNDERPMESEAPFIMEVPEDYRDPFESDINGAIKDIAGIALHGASAFVPNLKAIHKAFGSAPNLFKSDWCNFVDVGVQILKRPIPYPKAPRAIHIDLSLQVDNAAFAMGCIPEFVVMDRGGGLRETLPMIHMDGLLTIRPTGGQQIPIYKLKKLVLTLKQLGYPIRYVTLDGFQSADFIQTMGRSGFLSGIVSMDRTPAPYMNAKQAILDGRVHGPPNEVARTEFSRLVWVSQKGKVDHPPDGSKDLADAVTGVIHFLSTRREIWTSNGVDIRKATSLAGGEVQ